MNKVSFPDIVVQCNDLAKEKDLGLSYPRLIMAALYVKLSHFSEKGNVYLFNLKSRYSSMIPFSEFDGLVDNRGFNEEWDVEELFPIINDAFGALHCDDLEWISHLYNSTFFREQLKRDDIDSDYGEDNRYFIGDDEYASFFNEDCLWSFLDGKPYQHDIGEWPIRNHYILKGHDLTKEHISERMKILTHFGSARVKNTVCLIEGIDWFKRIYKTALDNEAEFEQTALNPSIQKDARMIAIPDRIVADETFVLQDFFIDDPKKVVQARVLNRTILPIPKQDYTKEWFFNTLGISENITFNLPTGAKWDVGYFDDREMYFADSTTMGISSKITQKQIEGFFTILVEFSCVENTYPNLIALACRLTGRKLSDNPQKIKWIGPNNNELPFLIWRLSLDKPQYKLSESFFDNYSSKNAPRRATRKIREEFIDALDTVLVKKETRKPEHG